MRAAERFARLQQQALRPAWEAALPGSGLEHTTVALPSYSLDRSLLEHYGPRLPALEHRYLHSLLLARAPHAHLVFLSSTPVHPDVLEGYVALIPPADRDQVLSRVHLVHTDDPAPVPLATKLLARPDLLDRIRQLCADHGPAMIEGWNVTEHERDLALTLGLPVFGTAPELRSLATKSNGRRLMRAAGVPLPAGVGDLHDVEGVLTAVQALEAAGDAPAGVIAKLNDSGAGEGNVVIAPGLTPAETVALLPDWWVEELADDGGMVEARITGTHFRSPSCQATISPAGDVTVLSTHEQRLGGADGQVYEGCNFPADGGYAGRLAEHTLAIGNALAQAGALGRFAVDFVVHEDNGWQVHAIEINLRKGGTTHPYGTARLLTGGVYDPVTGTMLDPAGHAVCYASTDNLLDPAWMSRTAAQVRLRLERAGVLFDLDRGVGVVPHMLDCLPIDGRMGYTAIGHTFAEVAELEARTLDALRDP